MRLELHAVRSFAVALVSLLVVGMGIGANAPTIAATTTAATAISVSLTSVANRTAITVNGTAASGLANDGYAFSSALLSSSVQFGGQAFVIGSANASDAVAAATIPLPAGGFNALTILATKCYGSANETFVVTYTDGTSTSFVQGMSDWGAPQGYTGETLASSMAYRVTPSGTTQNGPWELFGYTFTLNPAKTVKSLKLPADSNVIVFAVNMTPTPVSATSVSLSAVANRTAITVNGTAVSGLANDGYAFSSALLPSSVQFGGQAFAIGSVNKSDAVAAATIPLPAGSFTGLTFLATRCYGSSPSETFVVTYTDGTSTSFVQGMSDWGAPQGYPGETVASSMAYRVMPSGMTQNGPWDLFGYTFALNPAKTVQSLKLPADSNVIVFAVNMTSAPVTSTTGVTSVNLAPSANIVGIAANGTSVGGIAGSGYALSSTLLGNTVSFSAQTFTIGAANAADAVNAATITLPAGNYRTLSFWRPAAEI